MAYHFKNLVFEGGSVKGIAYVGALRLLEEKGIMGGIRRVGGTSAGAINAVFRDQAEPSAKKIDDLFDYAQALVETIIGSQESRHLHGDDWQRTVYIDTLGVKTTDFNLDNSKKAALVEEGRKGMVEYLEWFNDTANDPAINHPAVSG